MSEFLYGTYAQLKESVTGATEDTSTVAIYIGTAPVNLIRGYKGAGVINTPVKIKNYADAKKKIGIASNWAKYTLSEAVEAHFNSKNGNIGPIYVINVLDPTVHKSAEATSVNLNFINGTATFASEDIILDTFALADKAEGTDYAISYDFETGKVTIMSANSNSPLSGAIAATYYTIDATAITKDTIIGGKDAQGAYSGIGAVNLMYAKYDAVVNLIAAPGWSQYPEVYEAMVKKVTKLNGHWDGFVMADLPLSYTTTTHTYTALDSPAGNPSANGYYERSGDEYFLSTDTAVDEEKTYYTRTSVTTTTAIDTIEKAVDWKKANRYTAERSKVFYPHALGTDQKEYHLSTLGIVETMRADASHDGIPMETCGNSAIAVQGQYFGGTSQNAGYDAEESNALCENGIATAVFWGGAWRLWGDSTAAYTFASKNDIRANFDVSMRMLLFITNRFQIAWANQIDEPMTIQLKDTILNREQERLDQLVTQGALIGTPTITFDAENNTTEQIKQGNFRWDIQVTPTPPLKSASAYVAYSDDGFSAYFE